MSGEKFLKLLRNGIILFLFQLLVLELLELPPYGKATVFPLFFFFLPMQIAPSYQLLLAFVLGSFVDLLTFHPSLYTAPLLLVVYLRRYWLRLLLPPFLEEKEIFPLAQNNFSWLLLYLGGLLLVFELFFVFLLKLELSWEVLKFSTIRLFFYDLPIQLLWVYLLYK